MNTVEKTLEMLGFSAKETAVYLALLSLGPSPVRKIGQAAGINRGTTYDILRDLQEKGLASYYHKETHQYFAAEDPETLTRIVQEKKANAAELDEKIKTVLPELRSRFRSADERPVAKYYEGGKGIAAILNDVLETAKTLPRREYLAYSSADIRPHLYRAFPAFTERRVAGNIAVKVIAIGEGGENAALSERKWLAKNGGAPTYTLIYGGKVAMISAAKDGTPRGVMIEDPHMTETQRILFEWIWESLGKKKNIS